MAKRSRLAFSVVSIVALGAIVQLTHISFERALGKTHRGFGSGQAILPSAALLKSISLGCDQLLADCYWLAFVQYVGDSEQRKLDHYALADKYIDLITSLDPHLVEAYWFAAFTVGSDEKRPDVAAALIDRGIQANPDNWYLPFIAGINQYLFAHNQIEAAKYYRMAAKFPGAAPWLSRQADIMEAKIPDLVKQVNVWNNIYDSTHDEMVKRQAREKLAVLWVKVFKSSPSAQIRQRAQGELSKLGVEFHP